VSAREIALALGGSKSCFRFVRVPVSRCKSLTEPVSITRNGRETMP
jgi:hypothetical protein